MQHRKNIRELERLTNIVVKDVSILPEDELEEFKELINKIYLHVQFENSFRSAIKNQESAVVYSS
jgi:hypothetical protein